MASSLYSFIKRRTNKTDRKAVKELCSKFLEKEQWQSCSQEWRRVDISPMRFTTSMNKSMKPAWCSVQRSGYSQAGRQWHQAARRGARGHTAGERQRSKPLPMWVLRESTASGDCPPPAIGWSTCIGKPRNQSLVRRNRNFLLFHRHLGWNFSIVISCPGDVIPTSNASMFPKRLLNLSAGRTRKTWTQTQADTHC